MACSNNLKHIALAFHNYHDRYGSFPPAVVRDGSGQPLHSWRVLILPFLEAQPLYERFRLEEPWDSPHNAQLAPLMPDVFACPSYDHHLHHEGRESVAGHTTYMMLTSDSGDALVSSFDADADLRNFNGVLSEETSTRPPLVVDALGPSVPWNAPQDIRWDTFAATLKEADREKNPTPHHPGGVQAAWPDASVHFLPTGEGVTR